MLRIEALSRRFPGGLLALDQLSLTIIRGEVLALLGPSGCGKSTLLRLVAGLDRPDAGRLVWDAGAPPAAGRIGMVFQDPVLLPWADAAANAALPLVLAGQPRPAARADATAWLEKLGLRGFAEARPASLSGGMRMRVALARALSTRPDLLLLDEPFAALDEPTRHRLQADLRQVAHDTGSTVLLVTHSVYEAAFCADRVAVMTRAPGRITAEIAVDAHPGRMDPAYLGIVARISQAMPDAA